MNNDLLYEKIEMKDQSFPIKIFRNQLEKRKVIFNSHRHEQIEFWYMDEGEALMECNEKQFKITTGDLAIMNSNELHYGQRLSEKISYYCIIVDPAFLQSNIHGTCEIKYMVPIIKNYILFKNKVENDQRVKNYIHHIYDEYSKQQIGFELEIKASVYHLLVLLLRNYVERILTPEEYDRQLRKLRRFNSVFQYIENHYQEDISTAELAKMVNLSIYYFSRLFKELTEKTPIEYINNVRINKAEYLLESTDMSVTEVAYEVGFNDINYFSRLFKRYKNRTPSEILKSE